MIKPLSLRKLYRINHRKITVVLTITFLSAILQGALLIYATSMLQLFQATRLEFFSSITYISMLNPSQEHRLQVINRLKKQPVVSRVLPFHVTTTSMSGFQAAWVALMRTEDLPRIMQDLDLTLIQGHLPIPGSNEIILHHQIASNKGLKIGDRFGNKICQDDLVGEYRLTGLFDGKSLVGFADLDAFIKENHLSKEELPLLVVPQPGKLTRVKQLLSRLVQSDPQVYIATASEYAMQNFQNNIGLLVNLIYLIITGIVIICSGFLFYLFFYQRRPDFGLLEALGHTRQMIIGRGFTEIAGVNLLGFSGGWAVVWLSGWALNHWFLNGRGLPLVLWEPSYLFKLLSTPLFVTFCSLAPVWRMLKKVDPIAIIAGDV